MKRKLTIISILFLFFIFGKANATPQKDVLEKVPLDSSVNIVLKIKQNSASGKNSKDWSRSAKVWIYYAEQDKVSSSRFGNYANTLSDILFSNDDLTVYSIYPNPASSYAFIDYEVKTQLIKAKITIRDVLGSVVSEYNLLGANNKIRLPTDSYASGVYFYTLSINDKIIVTKKLVVKHQ